MSQRNERKKRWADDPEFSRFLEEEKERIKRGRAITKLRSDLGLTRSQFAALLRIDLEKATLLESGDFWTTEEDTLKWINESLGL